LIYYGFYSTSYKRVATQSPEACPYSTYFVSAIL
jgi:hypothetical protein